MPFRPWLPIILLTLERHKSISIELKGIKSPGILLSPKLPGSPFIPDGPECSFAPAVYAVNLISMSTSGRSCSLYHHFTWFEFSLKLFVCGWVLVCIKSCHQNPDESKCHVFAWEKSFSLYIASVLHAQGHHPFKARQSSSDTGWKRQNLVGLPSISLRINKVRRHQACDGKLILAGSLTDSPEKGENNNGSRAYFQFNLCESVASL